MNKLEEIVAHKRQELAEAKRVRPLAELERELKLRTAPRGFAAAIRRPGELSLIAEIKKASPSAGPIRPEADVVEVARTYARAGARAISVLTDSRFFSGSLKDLTAVRENLSLPVLRKDFLLEEYHVVEAAAAGADAVLLIAAILDPAVLKRLLTLARDLSLDALVEVHSEPELQQALEAQARVIGVNNRDLGSLQVDLKTTQQLMKKIPGTHVRVSESGIRSRSDVEFVQAQGADAILVGEELMSSQDPAAKIKELMG
ncbi:MAG: indole-3-glycerol phosphate synthase TrpC [Candidatus Omnitrophota bacterium]|nr:indole-3-glycerol phosphate synthase TrpC [Candidatus Omnitrophota bacterium]